MIPTEKSGSRRILNNTRLNDTELRDTVRSSVVRTLLINLETSTRQIIQDFSKNNPDKCRGSIDYARPLSLAILCLARRYSVEKANLTKQNLYLHTSFILMRRPPEVSAHTEAQGALRHYTAGYETIRYGVRLLCTNSFD